MKLWAFWRSRFHVCATGTTFGRSSWGRGWCLYHTWSIISTLVTKQRNTIVTWMRYLGGGHSFEIDFYFFCMLILLLWWGFGTRRCWKTKYFMHWCKACGDTNWSEDEKHIAKYWPKRQTIIKKITFRLRLWYSHHPMVRKLRAVINPTSGMVLF